MAIVPQVFPKTLLGSVGSLPAGGPLTLSPYLGRRGEGTQTPSPLPMAIASPLLLHLPFLSCHTQQHEDPSWFVPKALPLISRIRSHIHFYTVGVGGLLAEFQPTGPSPQAASSFSAPFPGPLGVPASGGPVDSKVYGASWKPSLLTAPNCLSLSMQMFPTGLCFLFPLQFVIVLPICSVLSD